MTNLETVQQIYAAFERGDIPAILDHLAENVEWEYPTAAADVPWLKPRRGRLEVPQFFEALAAFEFQKFQPKTMLENEDVVVALIDITITVKATGRQITEEDEVHIWRFNANGQVSKFGHKLDTYRHWMAYQETGASSAQMAAPQRIEQAPSS